MPSIRLLFLWHMHQPFYKDLVSGEYRLPWVRMHAMKDYYGMVKLLEEFPGIHQNFNLVPSLITQLEDYVAGTAKDPFLDVVSRPAADLSADDRLFALRYLFQANPMHMIDRYPRYQELRNQFHAYSSPADPSPAVAHFTDQDITDLQVLSQLAWFDEFFVSDPDVAALIARGRGFSRDDQQLALATERKILAAVLPAYRDAAKAGRIEISTSPFYHPILPLLCDSDAGAVSTPGLPLPRRRFQHPEDAREQLLRGLDLHQRVFAHRPTGVWPSEGSVSDAVLGIARDLGVSWVATDEGVLSRSLNAAFPRDSDGRLLDHNGAPQQLYNIYRWQPEGSAAPLHMVFRDHSISDLIGFVYQGMSPADAAWHFINRIKQSAQGALAAGHDAVVPIILDGENAWENFPRSGREFLRRLYTAIQNDPQFESLTISSAIEKHDPARFGTLRTVTPGSWIDANFNVWIGAPEDNRSWDYLADARDFYQQAAPNAAPEARKLAYEELMIAEGSDWNWWYGPEHHSDNDRDFDQLYRKHLSNVYSALGATPPAYLSSPIAEFLSRVVRIPQTAYIHPTIDGRNIGYFDWVGAAQFTPDRSSSSMHGKRFYLDTAHAGIDQETLFARLDVSESALEPSGLGGRFDIVVDLESFAAGSAAPLRRLRLEASVAWVGRPVDVDAAPDSAGSDSDAIHAFHLRRLSDHGNGLDDPSTPRPQHSGGNADAARQGTGISVAQAPIPNRAAEAPAAGSDSDWQAEAQLNVHFVTLFEFSLSLAALGLGKDVPPGGRIAMHFSIQHDGSVVDSLPAEGAFELPVVSEEEMSAATYVRR